MKNFYANAPDKCIRKVSAIAEIVSRIPIKGYDQEDIFQELVIYGVSNTTVMTRPRGHLLKRG